MQAHHVGVALAHHRKAGLGGRLPRQVETEQELAFMKAVALGAVHVLRALIRVHRARTESLHPPPRIADGKGDPPSEEVRRRAPTQPGEARCLKLLP